MQFYTGNFLDGTNEGQGRRGLQAVRRLLPGGAEVPRLGEQAGVEGEVEPVLKPGETYKQTTIYKFGVVK